MAALENIGLETKKKLDKIFLSGNYDLSVTDGAIGNGGNENAYIVHLESKIKDSEEPMFSYVPSSQLPENVLGTYSLNTETITISNQLNSRDKAFVEKHEYAHYLISRHPDNPPGDEQKADAYATARTGYVLRPPFKRVENRSHFYN